MLLSAPAAGSARHCASHKPVAEAHRHSSAAASSAAGAMGNGGGGGRGGSAAARSRQTCGQAGRTRSLRASTREIFIFAIDMMS